MEKKVTLKGCILAGIKALSYTALFLIAQIASTVILLLPYELVQIIKLQEKGLSFSQLQNEITTLIIEDFMPAFTPAITILNLFIGAGSLFLILKFISPPVLKNLGFKRTNRKAISYAFPLGIALQLFISLMVGLILMHPAMESFANEMLEYSAMLTSSKNKILEVIAVAVAAPLVEEIFFRGAILQALRKTNLPVAIPIIIQAFLFGVIHGITVQIVYATVIGIIFGVLAVKFDSIWPSIALHAVFNCSSYWSELLPSEISSPAVYIIITCSAVIILSCGILLSKTGKKGKKGRKNAT